MTYRCVSCGVEQPAPGPGWRMIQVQIEGKPDIRQFHFCASEFPAEGASQEAFRESYHRAVQAVVEILEKERIAAAASPFTPASRN